MNKLVKIYKFILNYIIMKLLLIYKKIEKLNMLKFNTIVNLFIFSV